MAYVDIKGVYKTYGVGEARVAALSDVSLSLARGELCVLEGPSGAGKTTLINLLGGMDAPDAGGITVDGLALAGLSSRELTRYRLNDVGLVFQFYNLLPNLSAVENVRLVAEMCKSSLAPEEVLQRVGLSDRLNNRPAQLSGGEQQRVSIARALVKNPKLILCDEPTGALDSETGRLVLKRLSDACRDMGKTVLIATHNGAIKQMADHIVRIKNGVVISDEANPSPLSPEGIAW